jgi:hypothetical protein
MYTIEATSVSNGLAKALTLLDKHGQGEDSRNGPVVAMPEPVGIQYLWPQNHVLTSPMRDANPFFHMAEAFWMLAGRNDVATVAHYTKQIKNYSDDGETFHGAYGYRWRNYFGYDQLSAIIGELKDNPRSRRCVLAMWDGSEEGDLKVAINGGKDVPCNTHAYFKIVKEVDGNPHLNMTVSNRSNDALWGAFGANAVHFSILMAYVADSIGVGIGYYHQISDNLHIYTDVLPREKWEPLRADLVAHDPHVDLSYSTSPREVYLRTRAEWDHAAKLVVARNWDAIEWQRFTSRYFGAVVRNVLLSYDLYKTGDFKKALIAAEQIGDKAWRAACVEWLQRRITAKLAKGEVK